MNKILIIKHGSLGDIIFALPALASIREEYGDAQIYILTENKTTGRIINTQSGSGNLDDLYMRNSTIVSIEDQEVGEADDDVVNGWLATQDEADKTYSDKRKLEYPPIGDQLDDLYHAGIFSAEMAAKLKAVKDKYSKE